MTQKSTYFTEIVGLRIYLALWVAIGHGLQTAGFFKASNLAMGFLLNAHEAVILFMIVSGFVITSLLKVKKESYAPYITRRFFRLMPAYLLACIAGYLVINDWAYLAGHMPWSSEPAGRLAASDVYLLHDQVTYNFAPHFVAHAFMLHGLIPDEILPGAPMTFLPAAWSISLEWQFYLIAPLLLASFENSKRALILVAASLAMLIAFKMNALGHYMINATLPGNIQYFLLGIVSRLFYDRLSAIRASPLLGTAVVLLVGVAAKTSIAPIIWGIFYSFSLWNGNAPITGRIFRILTQSRPLQVLGEASYSLYLIHRPLQILIMSLLIGKIALTREYVLATQVVAILVALPLSIAIHFLVERPGVAMGQKIARRLGKNGAVAAPPLMTFNDIEKVTPVARSIAAE